MSIRFSAPTWSEKPSEYEELGKLQADFLLSASQCLSSVRSNALRSHINLHFGDVCNRHNFTLARDRKKRYDDKAFCPHCLTYWKYGDFSFKVKPAVKSGKKMRKILRRKNCSKKLYTVQEKLVQAMHPGNTVVLKCRICQKFTDHKVQKHNIKLLKEVILDDSVVDTEKKGKKKKKKNMFHGLNPEVVQQICSSNGNRGDLNAMKPNNNENSISAVVRGKKGAFVNDTLSSKKGKKKKSIKSNVMPVTPLGQQSSSKVNARCSDGFIPLSAPGRTPFTPDVKKNRSKKSQPLNSNTVTGKKGLKLPNPHFRTGKQKVGRGQTKRLNMWKKLIEEEEKNQPSGSSLQDFLLKL